MAIIRRTALDAPKPIPARPSVLHDMIGRKIRLHYEEAQQHPLPARLTVLLDILDQLAENPASPRRR